MPTHTNSIERDKLYEQVWTTPIHTLCKQYGLSDRGLGKLCTRHNIPVPPRGYWARVEHGQEPPRPSLPPLKAGEPSTIYFSKIANKEDIDQQVPAVEDLPPEIAFERRLES